jgi:glycopeptide antibiotics resistance protein
MRFLLGVLVGYSTRGKKKLLITVLATIAFIVYIILIQALTWTFGFCRSKAIASLSYFRVGGERYPGHILTRWTLGRL